MTTSTLDSLRFNVAGEAPTQPQPDRLRQHSWRRLLGILSVAHLLLAGGLWARPPLTAHIHNAGNIQWERDGTEDGSSAHNHRSNQDFGGDQIFTDPWSIDHCWDNTTYRLEEAGDFDDGHCFIDETNNANRVRYRFMGAWNAMARQRVVDAFDTFSGVVSDVNTLVTGVEFVEVAGASEIELFWENQGGAWGGGFWSDNARELHLDNSVNWFFGLNPMEGQPGGIQNGEWHFFSVVLHEVGHAVGFEHQTDLDLMDPTVGEPPNIVGHRYFMGLDPDTLDGVRDIFSQPLPVQYWTHEAGNSGGGSIFWWNIGPADSYVTGDFNGDGSDELLAFNPNGWHHTMSFDGSNWNFIEGDGSGAIAWWNIGSADSYVAGDFNGDGRDEVLALNPNGWHHTMSFNGSSWSFIEGDGSGAIAWWNIGSVDSYVVGDFNGNGRDELLALNPNGWHHTMSFNGSSWSFIEGDGSGAIAWWNIGSADSYVTGNFTGGGQEEILAVNPNGWHHTMRFDGASWSFIEGDGSGAIHWWLISGNDNYTTGDYDCDGFSELLAVNPANGWSQMIGMQGNVWPQWQHLASNSGSGQMAFWLFAANDWRLSGAFNGGNCDLILNINSNGWWQVNSFP